jgi:nucleoid-associated protein YgaU
MGNPKDRTERLGEEFTARKPRADAQPQDAQRQLRQPEERAKAEANQAGQRTGAETAVPKEVVYVVKPGDSLSKIAKEQLGSAVRWTEIAELNKATLPNPNLVRVGQELKLPAK